MNIDEFIKKIKELNININEEQLTQLNIYADFLIDYNKHTNLTTIVEKNEIYLKHFYDSLTIVKALDMNKINNIIDIGTGAGFPGMVLKIIYPHLNVVLLDSNNKKITFLNELIKKLNLTNIKTENKRSEEYAKDHIDEYDLVTSRAVANLYTLSELCLPIVKVNRYFIPLKGNIEEELVEANKHIKELNGEIENIIKFNLPIENSIRSIIKIKKIAKNNKLYPRKYSIIKKEHERNINKLK